MIKEVKDLVWFISDLHEGIKEIFHLFFFVGKKTDVNTIFNNAFRRPNFRQPASNVAPECI